MPERVENSRPHSTKRKKVSRKRSSKELRAPSRGKYEIVDKAQG